jgi:hypothetical protein
MAELLILPTLTLIIIAMNQLMGILIQLTQQAPHLGGHIITTTIETVIVTTLTAQIVVDLIAEILVEIIVQPLRCLIV